MPEVLPREQEVLMAFDFAMSIRKFACAAISIGISP